MLMACCDCEEEEAYKGMRAFTADHANNIRDRGVDAGDGPAPQTPRCAVTIKPIAVLT